MLGAHSYGNNVRTTLYIGISDTDTTVLLDEATPPLNDPPTDASATKPARFTLMDDPSAPTVIEIIQATGVSAPAAGVVTLTGVTRGLEGTTAQSWGSGNTVIQCVTQAMLNLAPTGSIYQATFSGIFGNSAAAWTWVWDFGLVGGFMLNPSGASLYATFTSIECGAAFMGQLASQTLEVNGAGSFGGNVEAPLVTVGVGGLRITLGAPSSSSASGLAGQIRIDANYIYVCTASNTWKRAALSTF